MKAQVKAMDSLIGVEHKVLDHGFVRLVDYMGDDKALVQAARVSYGEGTKTPSDDRSLIRYMMRHGHTSPFEQCEIKFHIKLPIFVARQWMRHRMASYNEISGRYSVIKDEFYSPDVERFTKQSADNKQGSSNEIIDGAFDFRGDRYIRSSGAFSAYQREIEFGLSREVARTELPLSTYTEFYFKIDLHNLFNFLRQRMDSHAQWEIQQYANQIAELVKQWVPMAWDAFVDYRLEAVTLSRMEFEVLREYIYTVKDDLTMNDAFVIMRKNEQHPGMSKREITEFLEKWR